MAELDSQNGEIVELPETGETVIVEHVIPPNRPRKVYAGMWGPLEIGAVAAGVLVLLLTGVIWFFWVIPSGRELVRNRSETDRLEAELISAKTKYGEITSTETQVAKIVGSVDDFETRFLPLPVNGQTALYQRINGLIAAYGLTNTTGPDYAPLETADFSKTQQTDEEKGRAKYRSLYPGVYVTTTVEGSYQNLRRFIREIETGREFIIVSAVELAPSDTENRKQQADPLARPNTVQINPTLGNPTTKGFPAGFNQPVGPGQVQTPARQKGKTHGETVSLHIEMAAYFRRPNFVPLTTEQ